MSLIINDLLSGQEGRVSLRLPHEFSALDAPLNPCWHEDDLTDVLDQLPTTLFAAPVLHQMLDLLEFPQVEFALIGHTPLPEVIAV
jgi:hypothetical protein